MSVIQPGFEIQRIDQRDFLLLLNLDYQESLNIDDNSRRVSNSQIDVDAHPRSIGFEMQPIVPREPVRRRPLSRPISTVKREPNLSFYQVFLDRSTQDGWPEHCVFVCWGQPGRQRAIDVAVLSFAEDEGTI